MSQKKRKRSSNGWYVLTVCAVPDSKASRSEQSVKHFKTKSKAESYRRVTLFSAWEQYGIVDGCDLSIDVLKMTEDDFGRLVEKYESRLSDAIYENDVMDMDAFSVTLKEIVFE